MSRRGLGHSIYIQRLKNDVSSGAFSSEQEGCSEAASVKHPTSVAASKRLVLRYFRQEDVAPIFESYTGDSASAKYLARPPHTEIGQTEKLLQNLSIPESMPSSGKCIWVVDAIREGGAIGLVTVIKNHESMVVHFGIGKPYRGRGYAAEALVLTAQHLLAAGYATSVNTFTDVENVAAQKALKKAGFIFTTRVEQFYQAPQLNGEYRDVFQYEFMTQ